MTKKQARRIRKFEYFVISEMGDFVYGVAGPFKKKEEAIKWRKEMKKFYPDTHSFVVRKIKG